MAIDDFDFTSGAMFKRAQKKIPVPAPVKPVPYVAPRPVLTPAEIMAAQTIYAPAAPAPIAPYNPPTKQGGWK
jgi:hypothetical protein